MLTTFRRVWSFLDARDRAATGGFMVLMLVSAAMEMLSLALVVPLAGVVFGAKAEPAWVAAARAATGLGGFAFVAAACGGFAALMVAKNAGLLGIHFLVSRFSTHRLAAFQTRLFRHYLERPYVHRGADHSGLILRNLTSAAAAVFDALRAGLAIALELVLILAVVTMLAWISPMLALAGLAGALALGLVYYAITSAHLERWGHQANEATGRLMTWAVQGIGALKDIIVLNRAAYFEARFDEQASRLARVRTLRQVSMQLPRAVVETVLVIVLVLGMLALYAENKSVDQLLGTVGLVGLAVLRAVPSLNRVLGLVGELRQFAAEVGLLHDELSRTASEPLSPHADSAERLPFCIAARLEGVTLRYRADFPPALDGIDMTIACGETVGIIGPSGAGKSTLIDVLLGLLPPSEGRLTVDGADAFAHIAGWRANIGFVPQHIYLLDDTVRRNVAFGVPDDEIDEDRVARAVSQAHLDVVVAGLPHGLDTMVGEGGTRLSGGQRQRVGIARALYNDPAFLIFDEATSALDNETEREVIAAIAALKGRKTIVIVAHRFSTVAHCDRVYLLGQGRLVDQGTLDELNHRHRLDPAVR